MNDNECSSSNSWVCICLCPLFVSTSCFLLLLTWHAPHHLHCVLVSPWHPDGLVQGCIMIHGQELDSSPESDFWVSALAIICWHFLLILLIHKFAGFTSLESGINFYNSCCLHSLYFGSIALSGGSGEVSDTAQYAWQTHPPLTWSWEVSLGPTYCPRFLFLFLFHFRINICVSPNSPVESSAPSLIDLGGGVFINN